MKVSFIVPLYNGLALTQAMLASLQATIPAGLAHEIILADDASSDGTRDWLKTLRAPCRAVLNEKNLGFAATCNHGASVASGELLFFLNNDLVLLPGWLEPMLAVFAGKTDVGLVGNVQLNFASGTIDHTGLTFDAKGKPQHLTSLRGPDIRAAVGVTGACCAMRRATWEQLGGFDPVFLNGCEDVDLGLRARQAGFVNYVARRSVVRHHVSASPNRKLRDEQNTARLHQRWRAALVPLIVRRCAAACLAVGWEDPRDYPDRGLAFLCLLHVLHLWPASPVLLALAEAALDLEAARWSELFDQTPARPPRSIAAPFFPLNPPPTPIY